MSRRNGRQAPEGITSRRKGKRVSEKEVLSNNFVLIEVGNDDDPDDNNNNKGKKGTLPRRQLERKLRLLWHSFQPVRVTCICSLMVFSTCMIFLLLSSLMSTGLQKLNTSTQSGMHEVMVHMLDTFSVTKLDILDKPPHWARNRSPDYLVLGKGPSYLPLPDSLDEDCDPLGDWQDQQTILNCNTFHEIDITDISKIEFVGKGGQNTVWAVQEYEGTRRALKIPGWLLRKYVNAADYVPSPFYYQEDHRVQAVIYDELSSSPYIADMYGFCSHSNLMDYSPKTLLDLFHAEEEEEMPTKNELFRISYELARGLADAHHFDAEGRATIVHRDIKVNQFILIRGVYKLNDFNLAHLMRWNRKDDEYCEFHGRGYKTNYKAPEEYADALGSYTFKSEKADIYSFGYVLRFLLTGEEPFEEDYTDDEKWVRLFMNGKRLTVDESIQESTHPFDVAVRTMMKKCLAEDPSDRPSSQEVADYLREALLKVGLSFRTPAAE